MIREMTLEQCLNVNAPECGYTLQEYINKLFDFNFCFPEEYKDVFQYKFFLRYRYQPINYDTYAMFKNFLELKISELYPRYKQLYESQNLVFNPFVNYAVRADSFAKNQTRNKNYNTANGNNSGHSTNADGRVNIGTSLNNDIGNNAGITSTDSVLSNKETSDFKKNTTNLFTDSPQSKQSPDDNSSESAFNDGYVTTKEFTGDRTADIKSGINTGYDKSATEATHNNMSSGKNYAESVGEAEARVYGQYYRDGYEVAAAKSTLKNSLEETGIKGVTVSAVVLEWRNTFINIDKMFLDDLSVLFMRTW